MTERINGTSNLIDISSSDFCIFVRNICDTENSSVFIWVFLSHIFRMLRDCVMDEQKRVCACFNIWSNLKLNCSVKVWRRVGWRWDEEMKMLRGEARVRNNQNVSRCKLYHETRLSSLMRLSLSWCVGGMFAPCERDMMGIT